MTIFSISKRRYSPCQYQDDGIGFSKPLDKDEEIEYFRRVKQGDKEAQNVLVEHNMRLVVHIAKRYQTKDGDELISVGSCGLIKAVNTFDQEKGIRFSTYAAKCICNEILMYIRANKKNVGNVSLFMPIGSDKEGNEINLSDTLYNEEYSVSDKLEKEVLTTELKKAMRACLTKREYAVVVYRFGLFERERLPQREIAAKMNISRSYVSRIEKKALSKLKKYLIEAGMDTY